MADIELSLRRSTAAPATDAGPRRSRRASLADLSKDLEPPPEESADDETRKISRSKVVLAIYTLTRIVANAWAVGLTSRFSFDAIARPLVTGFGVYWFLDNDRYSASSRLHVWSWRLMLLLAFFGCDQSVFALANRICSLSEIYRSGFSRGTVHGELMTKVVAPWEVVCNVIQVYMTNMKLGSLGWHLTAWCLDRTSSFGVGIAAVTTILYSIIDEHWRDRDLFANVVVLFFGMTTLCLFVLAPATVLWQCGLFIHSAFRACATEDENIRSAGWCLLANSFLILVGPVLSFFALFGFEASMHEIHADFHVKMMTADICLQVLNTLLLSGLMGPRSWDRPTETFQKLAELSGWGLASKRIAFPGKINSEASNCIVSFPGKYAEECHGFVIKRKMVVFVGQRHIRHV